MSLAKTSAVPYMLLLALCACSHHRPAPSAKHADAGAKTRDAQNGFGNVGDGGTRGNGNMAVKGPGGCVRPGELNEFQLPLCPTNDAAMPPPDDCELGYDEFGRPICLDDAGAPTPPPPHCVRGGLCQALLLAGSGQLDVLFMIDDSGSMKEEQAALVGQMPRLIRVLTSGDLNGDGVQEFPAIKDLHLGVVSSDMGLPNVPPIGTCAGMGDDGVLRDKPAASVSGCAPSYPPFLSFDASQVDPAQASADFACVATLGTNGCGFEQPLEAVLKAITPSSSDIRFLSNDASVPVTLGHADGANKGFLRENSLVALVVVTDEDDCSAREPRLFTETQYLTPSDPLYAEPYNLRCYYNKPNLFDVSRYVAGFQGVRPPGSNLVLFAAIVGVPPELVDAKARAGVDFHDANARDAYYDALLAAPAMQEKPDPTTVPPNDDLVPSCDTSTGLAYPPRRMVEVAKGFGENAVVQSICQADFAPAFEPIVERISASLTVGCLPQTFSRDADGKIACDVIWELPAPHTPNASLELCEQRSFLSVPEIPALRTAPSGRTRCVVTQVGVGANDAGTTGPASGSGWYYDDFSSEATDHCGGASHQRVVFTSDVETPSDVRVYVDCDAAK